MRIKNRKEENVMVVELLESRLDAGIASEFKEKLIEFVNNGANAIVLDLSEVEFIDSSGLGAIVSALKVLGRNGNFAISGTGEEVRTMFKLTRMDRVFRLFDNKKEAISALSQ